MKKQVFWKKAIVAWGLCLTMSTAYVSHADTTQDKLNDTATKIDELEQQKQDKEDELENLNRYKSNLSGELGELDTQLYNISLALDELEQNLKETDIQIAEKETSVKEMEEKSAIQYENMKKRIQYTYENGQQNMFSVLLSSTSIADFLNRSEYATAINNYDRNMLDKYVQTLHAIEDEKVKLEEKRQEVVALKQEKETKQQEVHVLVEEKKQKISEAQVQISDAENALAGYDDELEKQRAYEDELERQKAREDAARMEELRRQREAERAEKAKNTKNTAVVPAAGDEALLAAIIECESGSESYEGKLAVGSVVLNRVGSSRFPNTVVGVIYQSGQFSPVASGRFATVLARGAGSSSVKAAREVLGGRRTTDALYFRRNSGLIDGTIIGNHVFY